MSPELFDSDELLLDDDESEELLLDDESEDGDPDSESFDPELPFEPLRA